MKISILHGVIFVVILMATSCHPSRPGVNDNISDKNAAIELTRVEQADSLLDEMMHNMYVLGMLTHDVVANGDAIIAHEEQISRIIKAIDQNQQILSEAQMQRYKALREEYRKTSGE